MGKTINAIIRITLGLVLTPIVGLLSMLFTVAFMAAPRMYRQMLLEVAKQFLEEAMNTIKFLKQEEIK